MSCAGSSAAVGASAAGVARDRRRLGRAAASRWRPAAADVGRRRRPAARGSAGSGHAPARSARRWAGGARPGAWPRPGGTGFAAPARVAASVAGSGPSPARPSTAVGLAAATSAAASAAGRSAGGGSAGGAAAARVRFAGAGDVSAGEAPLAAAAGELRRRVGPGECRLALPAAAGGRPRRRPGAAAAVGVGAVALTAAAFGWCGRAACRRDSASVAAVGGRRRLATPVRPLAVGGYRSAGPGRGPRAHVAAAGRCPPAPRCCAGVCRWTWFCSRRRGSGPRRRRCGSVSSIRLSPFRPPGAHVDARDRTGAVSAATDSANCGRAAQVCVVPRPACSRSARGGGADGRRRLLAGRGAPAASSAGMPAARSGPSGSASRPLSSSRPCANRVARGGTAAPGRRRHAVRRARRRVVQQASPAGRPGPVSHSRRGGRRPTRCRRLDHRPAGVESTAGRSWCRSTSTRSRARKAASRDRQRPPARPRAARPARRRRRSGRPARRRPARASTQSRTSSPGGSEASSAARSRSGSTALGQPDLQVLGLARHPGRRGADVGDLGVRGEAGRERHRHLRPAQRPLERAGEVAVGGEPQPAALGVAQAQPLHRRRRRRPLGLPGQRSAPPPRPDQLRRAAAPPGTASSTMTASPARTVTTSRYSVAVQARTPRRAAPRAHPARPASTPEYRPRRGSTA